MFGLLEISNPIVVRDWLTGEIPKGVEHYLQQRFVDSFV
jgi:hypothetical protein